MGFDYKKAGVDVGAGDALVDWLTSSPDKKPHHHERIVDGIGGFASLFRIQFPEMKKPCLVTCTDGVGTKVKLATYFQDYSKVGQDLVAMCVNDLICTGGRPLLFLDYYATGKLDLNVAKEFLQSVRSACEKSQCALVGGETAEMPGVYQSGDFDCAGFAVGIVDEDLRWGPEKVREGDVLLAIASSGFHSNGFSLLRQVFSQDLDQWKEILLTPTELYVEVALALGAAVEVHAAAHITGGGIDNIPRILPPELGMKLNAWQWPAPFLEVQKRTGMSSEQMLTTLNCGLGFVLVLPENQVPQAEEIIARHRLKSFVVGRVIRQ